MQVKEVKDLLAQDAIGLKHPSLNVLKADEASQYTVLALQPQGAIRTTASSIRNADEADATRKFGAFLRTASGLQPRPDLVICPEYSMPWEVLLAALEAGVAPEVGRLWALGCESLTIGQLDIYRQRLGANVTVIDESPDFSTATTERYLDPLVYLFRTTGLNDQDDRLVMLVQYKTAHSGDPHNIEAQGMFKGKIVYLFGRKPAEVRLLTLICSDVFDFDKETIKEYYEGLLLVHIQLNNDPRNPQYKKYRTDLFSYKGATELICVNWAKRIDWFEGDSNASTNGENIGGSAWYLRPQQFDLSDERLTKNQRQGLYYTYYDSIKTHALQLDYSPRAFHFQATKVYHHGVIAPASYLTGPIVLSVFDWSDASGEWALSVDNVDDGFGDLISHACHAAPELGAMHGGNPISVERSLAICAGTFGPEQDWHSVKSLDSTRLCEAEIVRRVTVTIDPQGETFRSERIARAQALAALRDQGFAWPSEVSFLKDGFELMWHVDHPHRNVVSAKTVATVIHMGMVGDIRLVDGMDAKARKVLAKPPEPTKLLSEEEKKAFLREHEGRVQNVCVLYNVGAETRHYSSQTALSFSTPSGMGGTNFTTSAGRPRSTG